MIKLIAAYLPLVSPAASRLRPTESTMQDISKRRFAVVTTGLVTLLLAAITSASLPVEAASNKPTATVNANNLSSQQSHSIVLGAGCFWGVEKRYQAVSGVLDAVSGYAGGKDVKPTYQAITAPNRRLDPDNHAEVVQVQFDPTRVSLRQLLQQYFEQHDPTQLNRQGNDIGTQYRSVIFYQDDNQRQLAEQIKAEYQQLLTAAGFGRIQTQIQPLTQFYPAENYHQDYLAKNPDGYCPDHSTGVRFQPQPSIDNGALLSGKQLLVLEAEGYCPYCEKFRADVLDHYQGSLPLHFRTAGQLHGLALTTPHDATPTLYLLENGKESAAVRGYLPAKEFYRLIGAFLLGDSEAYQVAFGKGTDARFCKQYDIFKNTPDGVFTDKISGEVLFDTRDRFDSGTGWLSFTRAVPGSTLEKPDNSYGMQRIEVVAKRSGIHLGHVFDDGPNGQRRFCINATVLDFKAR